MDVSTKMFLQVLVILLLCPSLTYGNINADNMEPGQCISRFDYDYRVLQKLLELENSLKNVTDKFAEHSTQIHELIDGKTETNLFGAHVVYVESFEENNFLKNEMMKFTVAHWWNGITDQQTEGVWKTHRTNQLATYTDWSGPPSNSGGNEDCVHFNYESNYKWNDIPCTMPTFTICEKEKHF